MKNKANEPRQVSEKETEILMELAREALEVEGDFVELGCYRGDTSLLLEKLLERSGAEKKLWIYDSFAGLPERSREDASVAGEEFAKGELLVTKREVVERFKRAGLKLPRIKKAFFEELDSEDLPEKISFGFLDGDLYGSIHTSLELVEGRLNNKAILVVHDYNNPKLPGVARAVLEWLARNPEFRLVQRETLAIMRQL